MLCSNKKNAKFIEVNTFPGFPRARRFNLSKLLYNEIIKDYKDKMEIKKTTKEDYEKLKKIKLTF